MSILIGQQGVTYSLYWLTKVRQIYEPSCLLFNVISRLSHGLNNCMLHDYSLRLGLNNCMPPDDFSHKLRQLQPYLAVLLVSTYSYLSFLKLNFMFKTFVIISLD